MIPFINASNPCKLICTSPSQKPIEVGTVTDGTPCSSSGICIEGTCFVSCFISKHSQNLIKYDILGC